MEHRTYYSLKKYADDTFRNQYPINRGSVTHDVEHLICQMAEEIDCLKKRIDQLERKMSLKRMEEIEV